VASFPYLETLRMNGGFITPHMSLANNCCNVKSLWVTCGARVKEFFELAAQMAHLREVKKLNINVLSCKVSSFTTTRNDLWLPSFRNDQNPHEYFDITYVGY
jgi:hypothetical protein